MGWPERSKIWIRRQPVDCQRRHALRVRTVPGGQHKKRRSTDRRAAAGGNAIRL